MDKTQGLGSKMRTALEGIQRVRDSAARDRNIVYTSLLHHATLGLFRACYEELNKNAAPGVDKRTWQEYGASDLEAKLTGLRERVFSKTYRALPAKRTYIPKGNGGKRPLGIPAIEDKIVQNVVRHILDAVYEPRFKGFSYGFRTGRGCQEALDALYVAITERKVSYVLDADIKGYFDSIPHDALIGILEERVKDSRIIRLIRIWLKAGILEEGKVYRDEKGTPQGSVISPLLANIYLDYVLDQWTDEWRKRALGEVYIIRYADDFIICFQYKSDASIYLRALITRLGQYGLKQQEEKTRLLEFGRFAAENRKRRGQAKPETFDFLGFTHICGKSLKGKFKLVRKTISKRLGAKVKEIGQKLRQMMHWELKDMLDALKRVLKGYYNYFAERDNMRCMISLRYVVGRRLIHILRRRSQKARKVCTWDWFNKNVESYLPYPVAKEYPGVRFRRRLAG